MSFAKRIGFVDSETQILKPSRVYDSGDIIGMWSLIGYMLYKDRGSGRRWRYIRELRSGLRRNGISAFETLPLRSLIKAGGELNTFETQQDILEGINILKSVVSKAIVRRWVAVSNDGTQKHDKSSQRYGGIVVKEVSFDDFYRAVEIPPKD
jgi:hypothetical protein